MPLNILLRKTSLVDFPGRVSSVFFLQGCNLRCPWCHNRELIAGGAEGLVSIDTAFAHLEKRRSVLDGVVISGGEPCLCKELPHIIEEIKKLSLSVKLDTNGTFPEMIEDLLRRGETRPDYIALDLKIAPRRYNEISVFSSSGGLDEKLVKSAALIRGCGIAHEYRTLALPRLFISEKDIEVLASLADNAPWYFRPFRGGNCLDPAWDNLEESAAETLAAIKALAGKAKALGKNAVIPA